MSLTLDEIQHLQEEGPSDDDVSAILEIEQRAHENGLQVYFWKCTPENNNIPSGCFGQNDEEAWMPFYVTIK